MVLCWNRRLIYPEQGRSIRRQEWMSSIEELLAANCCCCCDVELLVSLLAGVGCLVFGAGFILDVHKDLNLACQYLVAFDLTGLLIDIHSTVFAVMHSYYLHVYLQYLFHATHAQEERWMLASRGR